MDKCGVALLLYVRYSIRNMDASAMGKKGAKITNKILTTETRSKAAKLGWKLRKQRLAGKK